MRLFCLTLLSIPIVAFSQGFAPGYVIINNGDTVHGFLKHPFGSPYGFRFKDSNNVKKEFPAKDVKGFYIEKDGLYRKILFMKDSMEHVVKVIIPDYLSYYEVQLGSSSDSYYHILQKRDDPGQFWYSADWFQGFKEGIMKYLSDDIVLCEKIKQGDFGRKDIAKIVYEYNLFHEKN